MDIFGGGLQEIQFKNVFRFFLTYFNTESLESLDTSSIYLINSILITPYGPHILPTYLNNPIRIYKPNLDRNLIGIENRNRTLIYQWINLINGDMYVGCAWNGSKRLLSYWTPSVLKRNLPIYNSIKYYGHNNFILAILEDLGKTGTVTKNDMLVREQEYLNIMAL